MSSRKTTPSISSFYIFCKNSKKRKKYRRLFGYTSISYIRDVVIFGIYQTVSQWPHTKTLLVFILLLNILSFFKSFYSFSFLVITSFAKLKVKLIFSCQLK